MGSKTMMVLVVMTVVGWAGNLLANGNGSQVSPEESVFKLLIIPFGVATFFSITTTIALGLKMPKNREAIFPWHRKMAMFTMFMALCHVTLVILFH